MQKYPIGWQVPDSLPLWWAEETAGLLRSSAINLDSRLDLPISCLSEEQAAGLIVTADHSYSSYTAYEAGVSFQGHAGVNGLQGKSAVGFPK